MGKAAFFRLKINMSVVWKPAQSAAARRPAYSRTGDPRFVPLPIDRFQFSLLQIDQYNPSVFIVIGTDLCDRLLSVLGKYDSRTYHLPDVFLPFFIRII